MALRRMLAAVAAACVVCGGLASVASAADPVATQLRNPDASFRPKYRWWQPLAATDDTELRNELQGRSPTTAAAARRSWPFRSPTRPARTGASATRSCRRSRWGTPAWAHKTRGDGPGRARQRDRARHDDRSAVAGVDAGRGHDQRSARDAAARLRAAVRPGRHERARGRCRRTTRPRIADGQPRRPAARRRRARPRCRSPTTSAATASATA